MLENEGSGLLKATSPLNYGGLTGNELGQRTCLNCLRLHSLASPCPHRTDKVVTALRQWESGYILDETLSPHVKLRAREIAAKCVRFLPEPA